MLAFVWDALHVTATARGIRARNRAALEAKILVARRHLAAQGAAALSLAIARELGMASSALYRYVSSRDELLTLLIIEAYDSLNDAVDASVADVADPLERFRVMGRATRASGGPAAAQTSPSSTGRRCRAIGRRPSGPSARAPGSWATCSGCSPSSLRGGRRSATNGPRGPGARSRADHQNPLSARCDCRRSCSRAGWPPGHS